VVFAGTETGVYRSPNGGRGWKRSEGLDGVVQVIALAPDFHQSGLVLAGTESMGLWRSTDSGRTFKPVANGPQRVDALTSTAKGWLLSDESGLWRSADGQSWIAIPDSRPALTLFRTEQGIWAGGEDGATLLDDGLLG
jgi:hypothetical protein